MSKLYISIDIGLKGGIAIIKDDLIITHRMPLIGGKLDLHSLITLLRNPSNLKRTSDIAVFEDLGVIFGTSKATAFSMGRQLGIIEAACTALNIPYIKVKPKEWQKEMFKGVEEIKDSKGKRQTKKMAEMAIKRLKPELRLTFEGGKVVHDGLVDAVLIGEWAKRNNL
jgi:hypothetical protein